MPISPLPEATTRLLGSSLVISTPVHLVKELLDNAIDCGATFIEVLMSSNAVDRLEVRDNGHGIHPDDFDALGRPGHTSKLLSIDQLEQLGGTSLGFRGAALASASAMAEVSVTTRTSAEKVATTLRLDGRKGVQRQGLTSTPVGTTVCVTNLFSRSPVRSRAAAGDSVKNLMNIKRLLQSYALARYQTKLQLKVLQSSIPLWSYAPIPNTDARGSVLQLFGTDLASQCISQVSIQAGQDAQLANTSRGHCPTSRDINDPIFEAVLPKPWADPLKISKGAFFSVDSRPLSSTRGTAKKLLSIFRSYLGRSIRFPDNNTTLRDPFIRLNIVCAPGSYDVNVEPSKDDVLFNDEQRIIDRFEHFLTLIYMAPGAAPNTQPPKHSRQLNTNVIGAEPPHDPNNEENHLSPPTLISQPTADITPSGSEVNISDHLMEGLNPWSIAKLAAPRRRDGPNSSEHLRQTRIVPRVPDSETLCPDDANNAYTSARPARLSLGLPWRQQHPAASLTSSNSICVVGRSTYQKAARGLTTVSNWGSSRDRERINPKFRNPLPPSSGKARQARTHQDSVNIYPIREKTSGELAETRTSFSGGSARRRHDEALEDYHLQTAEALRLNASTEDSVAIRRHDIGRLRTFPDKIPRTDFEFGRESTQAPSRQGLHSYDKSENIVPGVCVMATQTSLPGIDSEVPRQPDLPTRDSRAYLIMKQKSMENDPKKKPGRVMTGSLPLETTPNSHQTQTLALTINIVSCNLGRWLVSASQFDNYVRHGMSEDGFKIGGSVSDIKMMESRLLNLLALRKEA
ncbi:hypothetical protein B0T24DRAFT_515533 [Lasiosphaeria ovina]|uniref:DNA mismatch repair protein S5 domain-containing protein n=1 Tax=Lasiosphaeria ovina TaxID=92902 RepID=A0AAE0TYB3_9PEZI|nr:hypothetical protein B0T24DRAFT_515533 [Lasiosphaeria ovina]